jgi:hypothetical protein
VGVCGCVSCPRDRMRVRARVRVCASCHLVGRQVHEGLAVGHAEQGRQLRGALRVQVHLRRTTVGVLTSVEVGRKPHHCPCHATPRAYEARWLCWRVCRAGVCVVLVCVLCRCVCVCGVTCASSCVLSGRSA